MLAGWTVVRRAGCGAFPRAVWAGRGALGGRLVGWTEAGISGPGGGMLVRCRCVAPKGGDSQKQEPQAAVSKEAPEAGKGEERASNGRREEPAVDYMDPETEDRIARAKIARMSGSPLTWKSVAGLVAVGGAIVYIFNKQVETQVQEREGTKELPSIGKPLLGGPFTLVDTSGMPVTDETYRGSHVLIYFGFCHCPDVCPDELIKIATVYDRCNADPKTKDRLKVLFITIDPKRDTLGVIKNYLKEFHPDFIGLAGTEGQIANACKQYRVYFSKGPEDDEEDYLVDHTIISYLIDDEGVFREYYPKSCEADEMTKKVKGWINGTRAVIPAA